MGTSTVTVAYVNPPKEGRKTGSIKTIDGAFYDVYPEKLGLFEHNGIYEIEYSEREYNGRTYRTVTSVAGKGMAPPRQGGGGRNNQYRPTAPQDAERMYVCALLASGIRAGVLDLSTVAVASATNALRAAWAETFGADALRPATDAPVAPQEPQPTGFVDAAAPLIKQIRERQTVAALEAWGTDPLNRTAIAALSPADAQRVRDAYALQLKNINSAGLRMAG